MTSAAVTASASPYPTTATIPAFGHCALLMPNTTSYEGAFFVTTSDDDNDVEPWLKYKRDMYKAMSLCDICNERITGTHYHCGNCKSPELTSMLGHYNWGTFHCEERRRQYEERVKLF